MFLDRGHRQPDFKPLNAAMSSSGRWCHSPELNESQLLQPTNSFALPLLVDVGRGQLKPKYYLPLFRLIIEAPLGTISSIPGPILNSKYAPDE